MHPNEHRPYIINPHWVVMSKSYFNQLVWTAKDRLQNPLASSRLDLLFMFGNVFSAIRNHVSGIHPHSPLIVSKDEDVDIDSFFPVTAVSFKDKSIPRHLLDHLIDCARKFESQFEDIDGGNILIAYSGLIKDSFPSISIQTLRFWMEKSEKTLIHDPFTEENVHDHAWLLGAMLGETSITLDPPSALVQIGYSNPLLVLDFLIPRYQLSGDLHFVIKLSPPFVDWLTKVSALGPAGKRNLSFTNNFAEIDEFIAGFMDVHLTIASKYSRIAVSLPLENVSEWLSVMPRPIPVDILGNGIIVEGLKHHSVTWYPAEKPCVKGYFFGRRYNDTIFDTEDQAITHIVTNLKYLYERVLPHCTHPRLERLFFAAQDIEDHFGGEREQDSYACRLRRKLSEMGGINTRELQDTLSRPVLDPDTGNVLIYKPKWLIRRMKEKNCTDADIFASLARHGPFIPFSIGWKGDAVKP
nr:hypothetical protein [Candidatus Sigynarchaeota archaeon]